MTTPGDELIGALALLHEPRRRRLYEYVVASGTPVGRDAAAHELGISRALAAFHLDRLVAVGLLDVRYRRLTGRTGPGAGRPAKLYVRAARELVGTYPPRDYGRAANLFADALEQQGREGRAAAADIAHANGRATGRAARVAAGPRPTPRRRREVLIEGLRAAAYEPRVGGSATTIRLRNCPFGALAAKHRDLTCGMNLAWARGLLDGLGETGLAADLAPADGYCCVVFGRSEMPQ